MFGMFDSPKNGLAFVVVKKRDRKRILQSFLYFLKTSPSWQRFCSMKNVTEVPITGWVTGGDRQMLIFDKFLPIY